MDEQNERLNGATVPSVAHDVAPEEQKNKSKGPAKQGRKKTIIFALIILGFVLMCAGAVYGGLHFRAADNANTSYDAGGNVKQAKKEPATPADEQVERFIHPTTGETWLAAPKKVANLGYYTFDDGSNVKPVYYEVGKRGDNTIYLSVQQAGPGEIMHLYEKAPDGTVAVIARPDSFYKYYDDPEKHTDPTLSEFKKGVVLNKTVKYDSLSIPEDLDIGGGQKAAKPTDYEAIPGAFTRNYDSENKPVQETIKRLGGSSLIKATTTYVDTQLSAIGYLVKLPIGTTVQLEYHPIPESLKGYAWNSGSNPKDDYIYPVARGCSQNPSSITRSDILSSKDIQKIGTSSNGQTIYQLVDINSTLATKAYDEFKSFIKINNDTTNPYAKISKEDFVHKEHGVVVYKDAFGQLLVYIRGQLVFAGGCAKPVVYLYPEKTQQVDVRVGAKVTVSDPYYNQKTGWKNVLARPNGQLTYNGKSYDSLFWEGYGYGRYPGISAGTVVKTVDAPQVIASQLRQLGLNAKEGQDFLDFWVSRLPAQKYTVMSWLTTKDMDQLAPLYVSPKPDTVIRVFLDFWGSDTPISLPRQQLSAPARKGFTVVEWGGLTNGLLK